MPPSVENKARPQTAVQRTIQSSSVTQKQSISTTVAPITRLGNSTVASCSPPEQAPEQVPNKAPSPQVAVGTAKARTTVKKATPLNSDAQAKQQGKRTAGAAASKPGAFQARSVAAAAARPLPGAAKAASMSSLSHNKAQLSQVEIDAQAKSAARAASVRGMSSIASSSPAVSSSLRKVVKVNTGGVAISRPEAVTTVDTSSTLDEVKKAASVPSLKPAPPTVPRGRKPQALPSTATTSRPGAVKMDASSSDSLENAVKAKARRASASSVKPLASASPSPVAKTSAAAPQGRITPATSRPGAVRSSSSDGLEIAVMAKALRASASLVKPLASVSPSPVANTSAAVPQGRSTPATSRPGAVRSSSSDGLEIAVMAKALCASTSSVKPAATTSRPGAVRSSSSDSLENAVMAKARRASASSLKPLASTSPSPVARTSAVVPQNRSTRPGAVNVDASSDSLENAVMAKARRASASLVTPLASTSPSPAANTSLVPQGRSMMATSRPGAVNVDASSSDSLENAVMVKARRASASLVNPVTSTSPSSVANTSMAPQSRRTATTIRPGAVNVDPSSTDGLENAVRAKARRASASSVNPVTYASLSTAPNTSVVPQTKSMTTTSRPGAINVDASSDGLENAVRAKARRASAASVNPMTSASPSPAANTSVDPQNRSMATTSRPGAVNIDASSDGLENAVMAKTRRASASSVNPVTSTSPSTAANTSVAPQNRSTATSRPGAVNVDASSDDLENAVMRKARRASASTATSSSPANTSVVPPCRKGLTTNQSSLENVQSELSQLEADVATKARSSRESPATAPGVVAVDGNVHAELHSLEEAVANKVQGEKVMTVDDNVRDELHSLEEAVAIKVRGEKGRVLPELSQLESVALAKSGTSSGRSEINDKKAPNGRLGITAGMLQLSRLEAKLHEMEPSKKDAEQDDDAKDETYRGGVDHFPDVELAQGDETAEGLAVAVAIDEDDEDPKVDAVATQYDPDAKPPIHKTKGFLVSVIIATIIMVAVVAVIIGILLTADGDSVEAISPRETVGIREEIEALVGAEELESLESPYHKALEWLIHQDPMELVPEDSNFFQRYIIAYLYFATITAGPWRSCNPPVGRELESCSFMMLEPGQYPPTFVPRAATRWLTSVHECKFAGVECDEEMQILEIKLNGAGMSGSFPTGIIHLPYLQIIMFSAGSMTGPLPLEIMSLKHLRKIDLQINEFTGEIPMEWWESQKLYSIDLSYNQIKGTLSTKVQDMRDLKYLNLHDNQLSGPIPRELGSIPNLEQLRLGHNDLEGPIPTEFGQLTRLDTLWLDQNLLTGSIPVEMSNMTALADLSLSENRMLGGTIPDEFYKLTEMGWLELYACNFTGTISPLIGNMKGLYRLLLNDNSFTGQIPVELGTLGRKAVYLEQLEVQNNNFQGQMPKDVCEQRVYKIDEIGLLTLVADCGGLDPKTGQVEIECECCSKCCTPDGTCSDNNRLYPPN